MNPRHLVAVLLEDNEMSKLETILREIAEPHRLAVEKAVATRMWNLTEEYKKASDELVQHRASNEGRAGGRGGGRFEFEQRQKARESGVQSYESPRDVAHWIVGKDAPDTNRSRAMYMQAQELNAVFSELVQGGYAKEGVYSTGYVYQFKPNLESIVLAKAKKAADAAISGFVAKNMAKMAGIMDAKGQPAKIQHWGNIVDGGIRFDFPDETGFIVYSSMIINVSVYGKLFNQFPTRFTDVRLPGGTVLKAPSERKVKEAFSIPHKLEPNKRGIESTPITRVSPLRTRKDEFNPDEFHEESLTLSRGGLSKGWMAPNGDVVPVYGHGSWEYKGRQYRYGQDVITGWLRLVQSGGTLYIGDNYNTAQLRELRNMAIENGWELVDDQSRHIEL